MFGLKNGLLQEYAECSNEGAHTDTYIYTYVVRERETQELDMVSY